MGRCRMYVDTHATHQLLLPLFMFVCSQLLLHAGNLCLRGLDRLPRSRPALVALRAALGQRVTFPGQLLLCWHEHHWRTQSPTDLLGFLLLQALGRHRNFSLQTCMGI